MSGYLPKITYTTQYEGDDVTFTLNPVLRGDFLKILPAIRAARDDGNAMMVYEAACEVLANSVEEMVGLKDANGVAVTKTQLLDSVYFIDLVTDVFNKLISDASLGKLERAASVES